MALLQLGSLTLFAMSALTKLPSSCEERHRPSVTQAQREIAIKTYPDDEADVAVLEARHENLVGDLRPAAPRESTPRHRYTLFCTVRVAYWPTSPDLCSAGNALAYSASSRDPGPGSGENMNRSYGNTHTHTHTHTHTDRQRETFGGRRVTLRHAGLDRGYFLDSHLLLVSVKSNTPTILPTLAAAAITNSAQQMNACYAHLSRTAQLLIVAPAPSPIAYTHFHTSRHFPPQTDDTLIVFLRFRRPSTGPSGTSTSAASTH